MKRNCWTCEHSLHETTDCGAKHTDEIATWMNDTHSDEDDVCPKDADGCPGWAPLTIEVKATDLKPYHHGIWCSVAGGKPFVNPIVLLKWAKDGRISAMLDSHNFASWAPDEMVIVVSMEPSEYAKKHWGSWSLGPRPDTDNGFTTAPKRYTRQERERVRSRTLVEEGL